VGCRRTPSATQWLYRLALLCANPRKRCRVGPARKLRKGIGAVDEGVRWPTRTASPIGSAGNRAPQSGQEERQREGAVSGDLFPDNAPNRLAASMVLPASLNIGTFFSLDRGLAVHENRQPGP